MTANHQSGIPSQPREIRAWNFSPAGLRRPSHLNYFRGNGMMSLRLTAMAFLSVSLASTFPQQAAGDEKPVKTAAEAFKNVQVLKRVPADKWFDTMAFIAGSLGVTCDHCHTSSFELDEGNAAKLKA